MPPLHRSIVLLLLGSVSSIQLDADWSVTKHITPRASPSMQQRRVSRRDAALGLAAGLAVSLAPTPALAQRSSLVSRKGNCLQDFGCSPDAVRSYKFSAMPEQTEASKAAERRRADFEAGVKPRDPNMTPIRDPVYGKSICAEEICAPNDTVCYKVQGSCAMKG